MFACSLTCSMLRSEILKFSPLMTPCTYTPVRTFPCSLVIQVGVMLLNVMDIRERSTTAPQAEYADLPPGVGFEPKDEPLRRDINLLGRVLGQVLIEQEGEGLFDAEEEVRLLCKRLRFDYDPALDERLRR